MSFTIPTPLTPATATRRSRAAEGRGATPVYIYAVSLAGGHRHDGSRAGAHGGV
ncbi:MAG TPA: hypothetical protein VGS79_16030 [Puia sp.]|nr:hypothetical protein [Puia sp.]